MLAAACGDDAAPPAGDGGPGADTGRDASGTCADDGDCDDGTFCNGAETCDPGGAGAGADGCVPGDDPCIAGMTCNEAMSRCDTDCAVTGDADGDGHPAITCEGDDCDDGNAMVFPGATEVCDEAGVDEDCMPATIGSLDADRDGFVDDRCCNGSTCGEDCNDVRRGANPDASEVCDQFDNDCDGTVDEGVSVMGYEDDDRDGRGDNARPRTACADAVGLAVVGDDCDDTDPARRPGQVELCDSVDNDCDGTVDEGPAAVTWYADSDGDGFGSARSGTIVQCTVPTGYSLLATDCNDARSGVNPAAEEACNGIDDDCNGIADFDLGMGDFEDDDRDGHTDSRCPVVGDDCDDFDANTYEGAVELCDGRDNNCDDMADDMTGMTTWYLDLDGDGFGDSTAMTRMACPQPEGYVLRGGDCDDSNREIHPAAVDFCDGRDSDCDGDTDDAAVRRAYYSDSDGDMYGGGMPMLSCTMPAGGIETPGDCDDTRAAVHPGVAEACNAADEDCDTRVDEGIAMLTCGVGACMRTVAACTGGMTATCTPGMATAEDCNAIDDDCDGTVDDEPAAGVSCNDAGTVGACVGGMCSIVACRAGYQDCNAMAPDGCEINIFTNPLHCGACRRECRAGDTCASGRCANEVIEVAAGTNHTCALVGSGRVFCWGQNGNGQLGLGDTMPRTIATEVPGITTATDITAGGSHTCVSLADSTVRCWGSHSRGQIGHGGGVGSNVLVPTAPQTVAPPGTTRLNDVVEVWAGLEASCGRRSAGTIRCWGQNAACELGYGGSSYYTIAGIDTGIPSAITTAIGLFAGGSQGAALTPAGLRIWGRNVDGELGLGRSTAYECAPMSPTVPTADVIDVGMGVGFTCLRRMTGQLQCAGAEGTGQTGLGVGSGRVLTFMNTDVTDATELSSGRSHSCALSTARGLVCWGLNDFGQLGDGTRVNRFTSTAASIVPAGARGLALGGQHSCAILPSGSVACWGLNGFGQLGDSTTMDRVGAVTIVVGLP